MTIDPFFIVMGVGFLVGVLVLLTIFLARSHDQVVRTAGPLRELAEIEAQRNAKLAALADIDEKLAQQNEALSDFARIQADVDALMRQREELQEEYAQLADRRQEIRDLDYKTDEAVQKYANAERDLLTAETELQAIQDRIERGERLQRETEEMDRRASQLREDIARLTAEASDLQALQRDEEGLRQRIQELTTTEARLGGEVEAGEARLSQVTAQIEETERSLAALRSDHIGEASRAAVVAEKIASLESDVEALEARRTRLDVQVAQLEERKTSLTEEFGRATSEISGEQDGYPLEKLQSAPKFLRRLASLPERALQNEEDAIAAISPHLKRHGLDYPYRIIRAFHTAMKVNETTQLAVLAGISGTGKSQLPRRYAEAMGMGFLVVPVQPRWDSPQDLVGFYNYIEKGFRPTDLGRALWHLDQFNEDNEAVSDTLHDRMLLVLLDEMNLARVEYYFSDFLSRLENRPPHEAVASSEARRDAELEFEIPMLGRPAPRIFPGYNVLFAGTMNEDESTQSISDKVMDRANVLRFAAPRDLSQQNALEHKQIETALPFSRWRSWLRPPLQGADGDRARTHLSRMVEIMRDLNRPIGHRLGRAILAYAANYPQLGSINPIQTALADQVEMRLLPKLRGIGVDDAGNRLNELADFVDADLGDNDLAHGIRHSLEHSRTLGRFQWLGVTRQ